MSVKVILLQDVPDLGDRGAIVDVADGYARNYLVPKRKAVKATPGAIAQADAMQKAREETERKLKAEAERLATTLVGTRVVVAARAGDEGRLFGSIPDHHVVEAIKKFTGEEVDRKIVTIDAPIREIGLHEVTLKPHPDVEFKVTLDVIPA
jgi:large subunit ribosomal protein L9